MSQLYQYELGGAHLPIDHPPSVNEPSSEVDDIDMDMAPTSTLATGHEEIKYICLDTNILVHHLPLVAQLHTFLCSRDGKGHSNSGGRGRGGWCLLVPTVVINGLSLSFPEKEKRRADLGVELDKLSSSTAPALQGHFDAPLTIGDLTQAATQWLGRTTLITPTTPPSRPGETNAAPVTSDPLGAEAHSDGARPASRLRLQAWDERLHPTTTLTKGDDRVLDCCLYYRQHYTTRVVLWTQDKNLSILATANRVDVLKVPRMSLAGIAMALKLDLPARPSMQDGRGQDRTDTTRQYGMDLDLDLDLDSTLHDDTLDMQYEANDHLRALLPDSTAFAALDAPTPDLPSRIPPHAQSPSSSRSHLHRTTPPSSMVIPPDILRQIDIVFLPLATYLANLADRPSPPPPPPPPNDPITVDTTSPPLTTANATAALIQHAYDSFDHLDATRFPPIVPGQTKMTPDRMAVLRAMGCLKTLCLFLVPRDARRPRRGEVIEALQDLVEQLAFLHVPIDAHTVTRIVEDIQNLSA